jgi:ribosomal-protein-alanine N-acetyltransferase
MPASSRPESTVLETDRLFLREMDPTDVDAIFEFLGDAETMRYYPSPKTWEETLGWIEWSRRSYAEHGFGLWASILKETGELVGDCGLTLQQVDDERFVEVGYHLNKAYWHRGLATEAAVACRNHAFDVVGVDRLIALVRPENTPSCGVAERLGLRVWRETQRAGPRHLVYSMTRDEWRQQPISTGSAGGPSGTS